ncbi:MAG: HAMP domain-containing protein [Geminicoccaceae bacterium]|nr:HAMP domain-containing protein [Geminicoccaceae bacterium]
MTWSPSRRLPGRPRSLAGQMVAVLILALLVAQAIAALAFLQDRERALVSANRGQVVERSVALVRLLAASPPGMRETVLRAMRAPGFAATLDAEPTLDRDDEDEGGRRLARSIERRIEKAGAGPVRVEIDEPSWFERRRERTGEVRDHDHHHHRGRRHEIGLALSIRLPDGLWLNLDHALRPPPFWRAGPMLYLLLTGGAVSLAGIFMVRRIVRPVRALADAAERLGRGEPVRPLTAGGPRELAGAALAFNAMQDRLRRFVDDRSRMLAAISHDLRTPITSLRLRAEFVEDEETRTKILETLAEMEAMTEATLAFLREEAGAEAVRPVDLRALLESIADDLRDQGASIRLEEGPRHVLRCRPLALKRALRNIVENAVRYGGPPGGTDAAVRIAVADAEGGVSIRVEDDGPGIPDADLDRVFEPFVRLEGSRSRVTGGSGLGLAIARSIVRGHGGEITLANRSRGGLRVELFLPSPAS